MTLEEECEHTARFLKTHKGIQPAFWRQSDHK